MTLEVGTFPIRLDDQRFHIDIASWKSRDVTDFSPKTTVPGTGAVFGDLQLHQPIAMTNWQHGFGFIWHEDEFGYLTSTGNIDTRHKNVVSLFTKATASDTNNNAKKGGLVFNGNFLTWGNAGVRYYDGSWNATNVQRAIFDTASEGSGVNIANSGTVTISHTVTNEGSDRLLLVFVVVDNASAITGGMESGITATYGGGAMTLVPSSGNSNTVGVVAFYMNQADMDSASITAGTAANVVVTFGTDAGGDDDAVILCASFIYVNQTTPFDALAAGNEETGTGTSNEINPTVTDRELVVDFLGKVGSESGDAVSVQNTGQTEIAQDDDGTDLHGISSYIYAQSADHGGAMAAGNGLSWSWTNSQAFCHLAIAVNPIAEVTVDFLFENGEYLFAQPTNQRLMRSTSGTADFVPAGFNNSSTAYSWIEMHGGYIFAGKSAEAEVYFDANSDLSALAGDPADDADELIAGPGTTGTKSGISFLEKLAVSRDDGLWTMDTDDSTTTNWISKRTLNFKNLSHANNFRTMATWGGSLYFTIQDKIIYEWNGAKLQNITPGPITDSWEYVTYHRFSNFTPFGDWLLMSARTSETTYDEALLAWDGVGFHKLLDVVTDSTTATISMISIDTANNYIWYHVSDSGATDSTDYVQYQTDSEYPHPNFPTSGTHRITTSRIHAGFRRVQKSMPALWVETDNCNSTQTIAVSYAIDDGTTFHDWTTLNTNGEHILYLPQNQLTEEFSYIRLRFTLSTGSASETPVLEGFAMMVMMRPDFKMGYTFDVLGGTNVASGMHEDNRTGYSIMHDLRTLRNKKAPIELVTPFGDKVYGYLTSITENAVEYEPEDYTGGSINILQLIRCNFVETMVVEGTEGDVKPRW